MLDKFPSCSGPERLPDEITLWGRRPDRHPEPGIGRNGEIRAAERRNDCQFIGEKDRRAAVSRRQHGSCVVGVVGSWANAFNLPTGPGGDLVAYPNLSSRNAWFAKLIPVGEEWSFHEVEDGWSGELIPGSL